MARLYVVNTTGQNRIVNYRLDFTVDEQGRRTSEKLVPYRSMLIPARTQVPFGGDLHPMQIQEIVEQIEKTCGAVNSSQIRSAKALGVVKMIWQEDKPIAKGILADVVDHNMGLLNEMGEQRRRQLAIVADATLTNLIDKTPAKMELEFEQMEEDNDLSNSKRLEQGLRVVHKEEPPKAPARRPRARRAA